MITLTFWDFWELFLFGFVYGICFALFTVAYRRRGAGLLEKEK